MTKMEKFLETNGLNSVSEKVGFIQAFQFALFQEMWEKTEEEMKKQKYKE